MKTENSIEEIWRIREDGRLFLAWLPEHSNMPVNNRAFWEKKLTANKVRDRLVTRTLRQRGWRVIRIWEHNLAKRPEQCVRRIKEVAGCR